MIQQFLIFLFKTYCLQHRKFLKSSALKFNFKLNRFNYKSEINILQVKPFFVDVIQSK